MKVKFKKSAEYGDLGYIKQAEEGEVKEIKDIPVAKSLISQGICECLDSKKESKPATIPENKMVKQDDKETKAPATPKKADKETKAKK